MSEREPLTHHPAMPDHRWIFPAQLIEVLDGDTLSLTIDLGFGMRLEQTPDRRNRVRLIGIDCPETRRAETREAGLAARAYAVGWLAEAAIGGEAAGLNWPLRVEVVGFDNFGRILGGVWRVHDRRSLSGDLLAAGHAVPYRAEAIGAGDGGAS